MPITLTQEGRRAKATAFVPLIKTKASGERVAYIPAPYERGKQRRWTIKRAREWGIANGFTRVFIDSRRRDGTTYWKEIRL